MGTFPIPRTPGGVDVGGWGVGGWGDDLDWGLGLGFWGWEVGVSMQRREGGDEGDQDARWQPKCAVTTPSPNQPAHPNRAAPTTRTQYGGGVVPPAHQQLALSAGDVPPLLLQALQVGDDGHVRGLAAHLGVV